VLPFGVLVAFDDLLVLALHLSDRRA
jgi:hypothetical protein